MRQVIKAFPELMLKPNKFQFLPSTTFTLFEKALTIKSEKYWTVPENRKAEFYAVTEREGFDPLIPENWKPKNTNIWKMARTGANFPVLIFHRLHFVQFANTLKVSWMQYARLTPI